MLRCRSNADKKIVGLTEKAEHFVRIITELDNLLMKEEIKVQ